MLHPLFLKFQVSINEIEFSRCSGRSYWNKMVPMTLSGGLSTVNTRWQHSPPDAQQTHTRGRRIVMISWIHSNIFRTCHVCFTRKVPENILKYTYLAMIVVYVQLKTSKTFTTNSVAATRRCYKTQLSMFIKFCPKILFSHFLTSCKLVGPYSWELCRNCAFQLRLELKK